jgi:hypothetical protein
MSGRRASPDTREKPKNAATRFLIRREAKQVPKRNLICRLHALIALDEMRGTRSLAIQPPVQSLSAPMYPGTAHVT